MLTIGYGVSPELTLRPLLSELRRTGVHPGAQRVAGANAPAFVERPPIAPQPRGSRAVSPELTLRPLLSGVILCRVSGILLVSPELTLRPLLSDGLQRDPSVGPESVAGANAPAFVERRTSRPMSATATRGVAGANAPAFVERWAGLSNRLKPPRVAGANAPAFVERGTA